MIDPSLLEPVPWPGFTTTGALLLSLSVAALATPWGASCEIEGLALVRKDEFHITVLDRQQALTARAACGERELRALYAAWTWTPRRTGRYALLHEPAGVSTGQAERWSLIEYLELDAMVRFRAALADRLGPSFADPVPHVTHFVAGDGHGIGLPNAQALACRRVRELRPPHRR